MIDFVALKTLAKDLFVAIAMEDEKDVFAVVNKMIKLLGIVTGVEGLDISPGAPPTWFALPLDCLIPGENGRLKPSPMRFDRVRGYRPMVMPLWWGGLLSAMYNNLYAAKKIQDCLSAKEFSSDKDWRYPEYTAEQWKTLADSVLELAPEIGYDEQQIAGVRKRIV